VGCDGSGHVDHGAAGVALPTPASLEAAWKYFILCGVGIAQALFGTILLYFAAEKLLGAEGGALLWTALNDVKGSLEPTVLSLAFVFLLVGYGTKVGLVPLHNWLPDAHAEGPTPVSAVLSGLLLNVALYAVVRCKVLVEGSVQTSFARELMMGFGCYRWSSRPSCCRDRRTSSACSRTRRSSTWASSRSHSAWAGRLRTSPLFCT
jgi:formate hydrogenlyase subunit 3/multisubunit Na+/H+ antiporter MnhD subunit